MTRLAGQVALVTHATSHLNAAIARRLAAEGACMVLSHGHDEAEAAARLKADIVWRGGCAMTVAGDAAVWPELRRLLAKTEVRFGRLDLLVNDIRGGDSAAFGAMLLCQEAVRRFGAEGGTIVNLGATGASEALTRGLARVLRSCDIQVHSLAPAPRDAVVRRVADLAAAHRHAPPLLAAG